MKKIVNVLFIALILFFPIFSRALEKEPITLYFFHGDGCPHCAEEEKFLEELKKDYPDLVIQSYEVWYNDENAQLLEQVNKAFSIQRVGVPTNVIGTTVISGYSDSQGEKIRRAVEFYQENEYLDVVSQIQDGTYNFDVDHQDEFQKKESESDKEVTVDIPFVGKYNLKKFSLMR